MFKFIDILISTCKDKDKPSQISQEDFNDLKALLHPFKENSIAALKTVDGISAAVRTDISEADDISVYDINDCVEASLKYGW